MGQQDMLHTAAALAKAISFRAPSHVQPSLDFRGPQAKNNLLAPSKQGDVPRFDLSEIRSVEGRRERAAHGVTCLAGGRGGGYVIASSHLPKSLLFFTILTFRATSALSGIVVGAEKQAQYY